MRFRTDAVQGHGDDLQSRIGNSFGHGLVDQVSVGGNAPWSAPDPRRSAPNPTCFKQQCLAAGQIHAKRIVGNGGDLGQTLLPLLKRRHGLCAMDR